MAQPLKVSVLLEAIAETVGFEKFKQKLEETEIASKKHGHALNQIKEIGMGVAGGAAVVGGLILEASHASIEYAESIYNQARAANVSAESFQVLAHLAKDSGGSIEQLTKVMDHLQVAAADAANGNEEISKKFSRLGISAKEFAALKPEEQMERLGRAVVNSSNQQEAFAATMDLVGAKQAPMLMAALKELGAEGFDEVATKAKAAGLVMDETMVKRLHDAGDRIDEFKVRLTILAGQFIDTALLIEQNSSRLSEALDRAAHAGKGTNEERSAQLELAQAYIAAGNAKAASYAVNNADSDGTLANSKKQLRGSMAQVQKDFYATRRALAELEEKDKEKAGEKIVKKEKDNLESKRAAIESMAKENGKLLDKQIKEFEKSESQKTKAVQTAQAEQKRLVSESNKERINQEKRFQDALNAVANHDVNSYQKRGLALGPSGVAMPGAVGQNPFAERPRLVLPPSTSPFSPNNAGREDARVTKILESIDLTLKKASTGGGLQWS